MGIAKRMWMEQQETEFEDEEAQWIRDQLADDDANKSHPEWDELSRQYRNGGLDYYDYSHDWEVQGKTRLELFEDSVFAGTEMLNVDVSAQTKRAIYVMVFAHVVAAVEGFLATTFITTTLSSSTYIQRLVESDPEFAERKLTVKEIFSKHATLKDDIGTYLKDLIFHRLDKVKPMFKAVFDIDFGDIKWLFQAVRVRHDCVHRAGYDKDGEPIELNSQDLINLMHACLDLVKRVDAEIMALPAVEPLLPDF